MGVRRGGAKLSREMVPSDRLLDRDPHSIARMQVSAYCGSPASGLAQKLDVALGNQIVVRVTTVSFRPLGAGALPSCWRRFGRSAR